MEHALETSRDAISVGSPDGISVGSPDAISVGSPDAISVGSPDGHRYAPAAHGPARSWTAMRVRTKQQRSVPHARLASRLAAKPALPARAMPPVPPLLSGRSAHSARKGRPCLQGRDPAAGQGEAAADEPGGGEQRLMKHVCWDRGQRRVTQQVCLHQENQQPCTPAAAPCAHHRPPRMATACPTPTTSPRGTCLGAPGWANGCSALC
jgi:hypothetical protein